MRNLILRACAILLACASCTRHLHAQQPPDAPVPQQTTTAPTTQADPPSPANSQPAHKKQNDEDKKADEQNQGTSKDRLFYALPNFLTLENSAHVPPLTTKQKFDVVTRGAFDPVQLPWYAFLAGIAQADNSERSFGQGAEGYGKRLGAYAADGTIENYMTGAILPALLRQDPRYFQLGNGSVFHRSVYSVSRILITRGDSGHSQFNASEVIGSALASGISTYAYHPHEDRTVANTVSVWGSQVGYDTITFVVREFWPDIRRKMSKRHRTQP